MNAVGQLVQLVHVLPPVVGLALVLGSGARGPWRAWAVAFFGLSILGTLGSTLWLLWLTWGGRGLDGRYALFTLVEVGLGVLSLVAAGCAVAAVLVGRPGGSTTSG